AATIVEQRVPEGDQFVFVRSDGRTIQAEFVDPNREREGSPRTPEARGPVRPPGLAEIILGPTGSAAEVEILEAELAEFERTLGSQPWEELKARLLEAMQGADFWGRADRHQTLARLALMDRVRAAMSTASSLRGRLIKSVERTGRHSRELVGRLGLQLY